MFQRDIPKGRGEFFRVEISRFRSLDRLDLRQYWTPEGGQPTGTRRGINLPITDLPLMRSILQAAEAEALHNGLLDEEAYHMHGLSVPLELST